MKNLIKKIKKFFLQLMYGKYTMEYYRIELQEEINKLKITPYDIAKIYIQMYNDNYRTWGLNLNNVVGLEKIQSLTVKTVSEYEYIFEVNLIDPTEHKCYAYNNKYLGYEDIRINFKRNQIKQTESERRADILNKRLKKIKKLINEASLIDYNYNIFASYYYYDLTYHMIPQDSRIRSLAGRNKNVEIPRIHILEMGNRMCDLKNKIEKEIKNKLEKQRNRKKRNTNKKKKTIIEKATEEKLKKENGEEIF